MSLDGTTTIVTGAGRGIGRQIALAQAAAGAKVGLISRTGAEIDETARMIREGGGEVAAVGADITDLVALESAVTELEARLGAAALMVNNAGAFAGIGPVSEVDPATWWRDVETNVRGVFNGCRAVLPGMKARGRGRIVNLVGGGTAASMPMGSGYGSSKAAVMRFTECLSDELAGTGVLAFPLDPGLVRTRMTELQLESAAGRAFMPQIAEMFRQGVNVEPTRAADLCVDVARGRFDRLHGRLLKATDDRDRLEALADRIGRDDLRALRITALALPED